MNNVSMLKNKIMDDNGKSVSALIERLTTSGKEHLDEIDLKALKKLCKEGGDPVVEQAFRMLFTQMSMKQSQVRLSTLLIMDQLFQRSHCFRSNLLVLKVFEEFLQLTLGHIESRPLPPPKRFAKLLKAKCITCLEQWDKDFGDGYTVLRSAVEHLKVKRIVDFVESRVNNTASQMRESEVEERRRMRLVKQTAKAKQTLQELTEEVQSVVLQMDNCISLIIPKNDTCEDVNEDALISKLRFNSLNCSKSLDISIKPYVTVLKDKENDSIIDNIKDLYKQITTGLLPKVKRLLHTLSKSPEDCTDDIKRAIDLKVLMLESVGKFLELKIVQDEQEVNDDAVSTSDESFVPVEEKEGLELTIPQHRRKEYGLEVTSDLCQPSTSGVKNLYPECRTPLPSGKLCPRRDKIKCPFHGLIIPRDASGIPLDKKHQKVESAPTENSIPEWQDPALLRDIEAEIGIDLTISKKGKRKKTKYPGLKNPKTCDITPKDRIARKIFRKDAVSKVAKDLEAIEEKYSNKFEDQFNYALNS